MRTWYLAAPMAFAKWGGCYFGLASDCFCAPLAVVVLRGPSCGSLSSERSQVCALPDCIIQQSALAGVIRNFVLLIRINADVPCETSQLVWARGRCMTSMVLSFLLEFSGGSLRSVKRAAGMLFVQTVLCLSVTCCLGSSDKNQASHGLVCLRCWKDNVAIYWPSVFCFREDNHFCFSSLFSHYSCGQIRIQMCCLPLWVSFLNDINVLFF